nr:PREDICTED: uncharacterized protein LOC109039340 [Bemisia tabaci]
MSSMDEKVTPLPPFNLEGSLVQWLKKLQVDYNHTERNSKNLATHQVVPTPLVEFIFITSKALELPLEVKFLAVDLFDRFIRNQFKDLYSEVLGSLTPRSLKRWEKVEAKICSQLELRIFSCLQIASKFIPENSTDSKILSSRMIYEFIKEDAAFSLQDINKSEMRVFRTLNFQIGGATIITFVDALILGLYKHMYGSAEYNHILQKCYQMCEVVYLNHQEIYTHFFHKLTALWDRSHADRLSFSSVECNGLIKGAAIILTTARLSQIPGDKEKILTNELSRLTTSPEQCIQELSAVILHIICPQYTPSKKYIHTH